MDPNTSTTKFFLFGLFVISFAFLLFNLQAHAIIGKAFYVSETGVGFASPNNYPEEVTNINILAWSIVLMVIVAFIATMNLLNRKNQSRVVVKKKKH